MRCSVTVWLPLTLLLICSSQAQDSQPSEYEVKAAFIFNFAKFVEWPQAAFLDAQAPFLIGVIGVGSSNADLDRTVHGKTLNNRSVTVKQCRALEEARKCHVVFIEASEKRRLHEIRSSLDNAPVLTVGEAEGFIQSGGMIGFFREGNKLRFEINQDATKRAGLKVNSKLLSLARTPTK